MEIVILHHAGTHEFTEQFIAIAITQLSCIPYQEKTDILVV